MGINIQVVNHDIDLDNGCITCDGHAIAVPNVRFDAVIGTGANSVVFEGQDVLLQRPVVGKLYVQRKRRDQRNKQEQGILEARKLAKLDHPRIARVYSAQAVGQDSLLVVLERVAGPTLRQTKAASLSFRERRRVWDDISSALRHAHGLGVYHGDLHDGNVLIVAGHAVLVDFGTSAFAQSKAQSRKREVKMPWVLVQGLFRSEALVPPDTTFLAKFAPEDSLYGCDIAVEYVATLAHVLYEFSVETDDDPRDSMHDYRRRGAILELGHVYANFPFLSFHNLLRIPGIVITSSAAS